MLPACTISQTIIQQYQLLQQRPGHDVPEPLAFNPGSGLAVVRGGLRGLLPLALLLLSWLGQVSLPSKATVARPAARSEGATQESLSAGGQCLA